MKAVTIRLKDPETEAATVFPEIAKLIEQGYISGETYGAKWWIEDEE